MPDSDVIPLDEGTSQWRGLADRIERFVQAWESDAAPPSIAAHLDDSSPTAQRMTLVELIKIDLEYRWLHRREPRPLEVYLVEFPVLAEDLPVDLIYEECHIRRRAGETFDADAVCRRFPTQAAELRRLLGAAPALKTTTLMGKAPSLHAKLEPGQQVDDFELLSRLGEGAFGAVYLARQTSMQRLVALKVTADRGSEPQTLAQLDHENIVRVFDQRQLTDRGLRLMYMQFAAGGTLDDAMRRLQTTPVGMRSGRDFLAAVDSVLAARGVEPPAESPLRARLAAMTWPEVVCFLGSRLAQALQYAHQIGVLHRDIKPANVLLTAEGSPKLADFNISFSSKLEGATPAAYFGGSLAYMSPEQLEACSPSHDRTPDELDCRSDLYSLGVVLWELLTGERPFDDDRVERSWGLTLAQMTSRRRQGPPPHRLSECINDATPGLDTVLLYTLAPDTSVRVGSGQELARRLELCRLPRTQQLLTVRRDGWRGWLLRFPMLSVIAVTVIPNGIAGAFNYLYNKAEIIRGLGPQALEAFEQTQLAINFLLFPLGAILGLLRMYHFSRCVSHDAVRSRLDDAGLAEMRANALIVGRDAVLIGLSLWLVAGIAYPILMHWKLGEAAVTTYTHFFASMLLCGLVAAAYPFWAATLISVRRFYPLFVKLETYGRADRAHLDRLRVRCWFFLGLAALVPMTAATVLALLNSQAQYALVVSTVGGILGFAAALVALRALLADIDALSLATHSEIRRPATVA